MEAKCSDFIMKIWGTWTVLTIMVVMAEVDKSNRSVMLGTTTELQCPPERYNMTVWKVNFKNGTHCYLSFKRENNTIARNCSMNMDWVSRPKEKSAIQIKSFQMFSEGKYTCFIATAKGMLNHAYELTILVPPKVSLTHDNGTAVCKAAAGKPAAWISWNPPGHFETEMPEMLPNGTETIISRYNMTNVKEDELTCFISHPTWEKSLILNLLDRHEEREGSTMTILYSCLTGLLGILGFSLSIYLWRFCGSQRKITATTNVETISGQNIQENDLEPYAIFVQVENVIYDKAYNFSSS